jgi:hypothetical protein
MQQSDNQPKNKPSPEGPTVRGKAANKPKKPVGRPRKNNPAEIMCFAGIVGAPETPENIMELVYNNAQAFKKITNLFKVYAVGEVRMVFAPSGIFITGQNHTRNVNINVFIDGCAMNSYYCGEATELCSSMQNFIKSFNAIGKHHDKITMRISSARKTTLAISLYESVYANVTTADVTLNRMGPAATIPTYTYTASTWAWVLKFSFISKHFKNMVANIGVPPNFIRITKQLDAPLCIDSEGGRDTPIRNVYSDDAKLSLQQNLAPPNEIFSVSFGVDKIRPFANISLGTKVRVVAHNGPQISFMTTMDERGAYNAFTIEILIDIHGYRQTTPAETS